MVVFASSTVAGQASSAGVNTPAAGATYKAPRTPDGQPDLQGVWANNDATPLQRPTELAGRQFLTEAEVASLKRRAAELFNGETDAAFGDSVFLAAIKEAGDFTSRDKGTGNYNHFWIVDREFDNRTSIISDPTDGRIPPLTPEGEKRKVALDERRKMHPADGPEDLPLSHRCVTSGVPRIGAGYNSYFQIVQNKDVCRDRAGDDPRRAAHPARQQAASPVGRHAVARRLARPMGRRHAGRGNEEIFIQEPVPEAAGREPPHGRTVHPG